MPSEAGFLEVEGIEKTWNITQDKIAAEVDILSLRKQFDIVLPGLDLMPLVYAHFSDVMKRPLYFTRLTMSY